MKIKFWSIILLSFISFSLLAHPFYVSITSIDYNEKSQRIEIATRIFYDDLETALKNVNHKKIDVINPKNKSEVDSSISRYIQSNLKIKINGKLRELKYVGYEIDEDVTWCYFESPQSTDIHSIEVNNNILYREFKSQSNILHVTVNGKRKSQKLDNPKRITQFHF